MIKTTIVIIVSVIAIIGIIFFELYIMSFFYKEGRRDARKEFEPEHLYYLNITFPKDEMGKEKKEMIEKLIYAINVGCEEEYFERYIKNHQMEK